MSKLYNLLELIVTKVNTATRGLANSQPKGDYALKSDIPTKVSQLKNDSGYLTKTNSGGNGEENGKDGFSPIAKIEQTSTGAIISITDKTGTTTAIINHGKDAPPYTLTEEDKTQIVSAVITALPKYNGEVVAV